jgi:hypothetical protein
VRRTTSPYSAGAAAVNVNHRANVESLTSVWGSGRSDIWVVGTNGALDWGGTTWQCVLHLDSNGGQVSGGDVWVAAGGGTVSHWDGARWSTATALTGADAAWATRPNDVWVTSSLYPGSEIHHFDGATWTKTSVDHFVLGAVWGALNGPGWAGGADALACTNCGGLLHWGGTGWFRWDTRLRSESIHGIWGSAPDDLWAVGADGAILHFAAERATSAGPGTSAR